MTRGFQVPFFLLLLLMLTTGEGHKAGRGLSLLTCSQLSVGVSFFFLSFYILNRQYNSSLENPNTDYYQELKENISGLFLQIFNQDFLGLSNIKFSLGLGYQAGALPCWLFLVEGTPWSTINSFLPRLCVSAAERTTGSWTSFPPGTPIIL
uniref:Mucin-1 n=1 Tax=Castor canadensis TaxID=51338 RepID=A0A8C0X057_CASCN